MTSINNRVPAVTDKISVTQKNRVIQICHNKIERLLNCQAKSNTVVAKYSKVFDYHDNILYNILIC